MGKTESILFGSSRKLKRAGDFQITCEGAPVARVSCVKYLGVLLDENLSGKPHAEDLLKKCGYRISFLYRNAMVLNTKSRITLCSALVQPFMDYCSSSWYSSLTQKLKNRFDVIQRRMVRFIFGMHHLDHVGLSSFSSLSWLTMKDRVNYFKLCHVFRIKTGTAPPYLSQDFVSVSALHAHSTRGSNSHNFSLSKQISSAPHSFLSTAIKEWNNLPAHIKHIDSGSAFKQRLRAHFLSKYC